MEAKEKADELVVDLIEDLGLNSFCAREVAERIADEILGYMGADRGTEFWQEVKIEINKL